MNDATIDKTINPAMVTLARESRGKTAAEVSVALGVSRATWWRVEAGSAAISARLVETLASCLQYPIGFFQQRPIRIEGVGADTLFHRKRQSAGKSVLSRSYALAEIRRLETRRLMNCLTWPAVPEYPVEQFDDPAKVARTVRACGQMPMGPVFNMTQALENNGIVVFAHDFETDYIEGFSKRSPDMPPIIHINRALPPDRWRWTLAHELGHIIMHTDPVRPAQQAEREADAFAAEFLTPGYEIGPMLYGLDRERLESLKAEWRVSMQSLIMRAFELGVIAASKKRGRFVRLSGDGFRKRDPEYLDPPVETPSLPSRMARRRLTHFGHNPATLLDYLAIGETDFHAYYSDPQDYVADAD